MAYTQVVLKRFGGPEELEPRTVEELPEPQSGEVRIRVLVNSAAFTDVMIRRGMYPDVKKEPPFVPGYDLVGRVDAFGPGVEGLALGQGGESFPHSMHALRPGGMLVAFGFQNEVLGRGASIPLDFVKLKVWDWLPNGHATAFYSIGATRRKHPDWFKEDLARLFALLATGRIDPAVAEIVPLSEVRRAHERVEAGEVKGKLVMRVTGT